MIVVVDVLVLVVVVVVVVVVVDDVDVEVDVEVEDDVEVEVEVVVEVVVVLVVVVVVITKPASETSHRFPFQPSAHLHLNSSGPVFTQVPNLVHGEDSQSSRSTAQFEPDHPGKQAHVYASPVSVHLPCVQCVVAGGHLVTPQDLHIKVTIGEACVSLSICGLKLKKLN